MQKTIVMVDDHIEMLEAYIDVLENAGVKVISFTDVSEAKHYLMTSTEVNCIDAIVSDLMMGPTDGLDFLTFVKKVPELEHIDFYFITGTAVPIFEPFFSKSSVKGIIQKPCTSKVLLETLVGKNFKLERKTAA